MRYYTIFEDKILTAGNEVALSRFYENVKSLPDDYEEGKYITGEIVEETEVIDYDEEGNPAGSHTETVTVKTLIQNPDWEKEKALKERERINQLSLTKREVFLALYKDKGITPEQLKSQITEPEALIELEYANDYFRGNPLINLIGQSLGYSSDELDYLFENKKLPVITEAEEENG